ncbi:MAG: hypothetical protein KIT81_11095 [Alphaproteobacteria bacterium]|nr:hypothetical protein [Alphaproteobacteria bacterium]
MHRHMTRFGFAACLLLAMGAGAEAAADCASGVVLSERGGVLQRYRLADVPERLQCRVNLGSDRPEATYVYAHTLTNRPQKRDENGFWHRWDQRVETLIDNNFYDAANPPADRMVTFKIVSESLEGTSLPVNFHIAYVVSGALKYGVIVIEP